MTPEQYRAITRLQNQFPQLYSNKDREFLRNQAPLKSSDASPLTVANQLFSGFISGFTALGDYAEDPQNSWDAIANSVGNLAGFVGMFWPLGRIGGSTIRAAKAIAGAGKATKGFEGLEAFLKLYPRSVPMAAADFARDKFATTGAARIAKGLLEGRPIVSQALESGSHLGVAMFVSQLHEGVTEAVKSGFYGMTMGGFLDAGLGNIPILAGTTTPHKVMRAMAGGISQTISPIIVGHNPFEQPVPMLVYDTLLGAYFGYHARTWDSFQMAKYITGKIPEGNRKGESRNQDDLRARGADPEWQALSPEIKAKVNPRMEEYLSVAPAQQIWVNVRDRMEPGWAEERQLFSGQRVKFDGSSYTKSFTVTEVTPDVVRTAEGVDIPRAQAIPELEMPETMPPAFSDEMPQTNIHDFEGFAKTRLGPLQEFLFRNSRNEKGELSLPTGGLSKYLGIERLVTENVDRLIREPVFPGENSWEKVKSYIQTTMVETELRPGTMPLVEADFAPLKTFYRQRKYSTVVPQSYFDRETKEVKSSIELRDEDAFFDEDGNRRPKAGMRYAWDGIPSNPADNTSTPLRYGVISSVVNRSQRDSHGNVTRTILDAKLTDADLGDMVRSLDSQGRSLYGGSGDKEQRFHYIEYAHPDVLESTLKELRAADSAGELTAVADLAAKNMGVSYETILKQMANNAYIWKSMNKKPLAELLSSPGFIRDPLQLAKRLSIMSQKYYPVPREFWPEGTDPVARTIYVNDTGKLRDGAVYDNIDLFNNINTAAGFPEPERIGATKPFVWEKTDDGLMLEKQARFSMSREQSDALKALGIDRIVYTTAAKQTGTRQVYDMNFDGTSFKITQNGVETKPQTYEQTVDHLYLSDSIYDDVAQKLNSPQRVAVQLSSGITSKSARKALFDRLLELDKGTPEANDLLNRYERTKDISLFDSKESLDLIGSMDRDRVYKFVSEEPEFREAFDRSLLKIDPAEDDPEFAILADEYYALERPDSPVQKLLQAGQGKHPLTISKLAGDHMSYLYRRYFVQDRVRPRTRYSGSARLQPLDAFQEFKYKMDDDHFYLGNERKGMIIPGVTKSLERQEMTLEKQWKLYQDMLKDPNPSDAQKSVIKEMEDALEAVVARVPIDDQSGARSLGMGGFIDAQGGGAFITKRNMDRIGGADYDIDSTFFYFGMPKEYRDFLKTQRNNPDVYKKELGIPSEQFFKNIPLGLRTHSPFAMFDPYHMAKINSMTAAGRGENLGRGIAYKRRLEALQIFLNEKGEATGLPTPEQLKELVTTRFHDWLEGPEAYVDRTSDDMLGKYSMNDPFDMDSPEIVKHKEIPTVEVMKRISARGLLDDLREASLKHKARLVISAPGGLEHPTLAEGEVNEFLARRLLKLYDDATSRNVRQATVSKMQRVGQFTVEPTSNPNRSRGINSGLVGAAADASAGGVTGARVPEDYVDSRQYMLMGAFDQVSAGNRFVWNKQMLDAQFRVDEQATNMLRAKGDTETTVRHFYQFEDQLTRTKAQLVAGRDIEVLDAQQNPYKVGKYGWSGRGKVTINDRNETEVTMGNSRAPQDGYVRIGEDVYSVTDPRLREFADIQAFDTVKEMSRLIDFTTKTFRRGPTGPWSAEDISGSAVNFSKLDYSHEFLWSVAQKLKGYESNNSFLHDLRLAPRTKDLFQWWSALVREYPSLGGHLPERTALNYAHVAKLSDALLKFWPDVVTARARIELASDPTKFEQFAADIKNSYAAEMTMEEFYKRVWEQRPHLDIAPPRTSKDVVPVRDRKKWIERLTEQANDFISERVATIGGMKAQVLAIQEMNLPTRNGKTASEQVGVVLDKKYLTLPDPENPGKRNGLSLLDGITEMKMYWLANKSQTRIERKSKFSTADTLAQMYSHVRTMSEMAAKELGIETALMDDLVDALLLSPIRKASDNKNFFKTGETMVGLRFSRPTSLQRFANAYSEVWDITRAKEQKAAMKQFFRIGELERVQDAFIQDKDKDLSAKEVFQTIIWPKRDPSVVIPPEMLRLQEEAAEFLTDARNPFYRKPEMLARYAMNLFNIAGPTEMTRQRWQGMINSIRELYTGPTIIDRLSNSTPESRRTFDFMDTLIRPETLGKNQLYDQMEFVLEPLFKEGRTVSEHAKPKAFIDRTTGELKRVYAQGAEPLSVMQILQRQQNNANSRIEIEQNERAQELHDFFDPIFDAKNHRTGVKDGPELMYYASLKRELEPYIGVDIASLDKVNQENFHMLFKEAKDWEVKHKGSLADQFSFALPGGERTTKTGQELVDSMVRKIEQIFDKGVFLDNAWILKNVKIDPYGIPDISRTLDDLQNLERIVPGELDIRAEYPRLAQLLLEIERRAEDEPFPRWRSVPELMDKVSNFEVPFLRDYQEQAAAMGILGRSPGEIHEWARSEWKRGVRDSKLVGTIFRYFNRDIDISDWRAKAYAGTRDSQINWDMAYAKGQMTPKQYTQRLLINQHPFYQRGKQPGYFPRRMFDPHIVRKWYDAERSKIIATAKTPEEAQEQLKSITEVYDGIVKVDVSYEERNLQDLADSFITNGTNKLIKLETVSQFRSTSSYSRKANLPGASRTVAAIQDALNENIRMKYKALAATLGWRTLRKFEREFAPREKAGEFPPGSTAGWKHMYTMYLRNAMDLPSVFTKEELDDPFLEIKKTPYYWLSDHAMMVQGSWANKVLRRMLRRDWVTYADEKTYGLDTPEKKKEWLAAKVDSMTKLSEGAKDGNFTEQDIQNFRTASSMLRNLSQFEAKYEMASLLFSPKTGLVNLGSGRISSIILHGFKANRDAMDIRTWASIDRDFKTMSDVDKWIDTTGAVHDVVAQEAQTKLGPLMQQPQVRGFVEDALAWIKREPEMSDDKLWGLVQKHGLDRTFMDTAGAFMRKTERYNRRTAFKVAYIAERNALQPLQLGKNVPFLIEAGRKSVGMGQFLYDNANRGAFATTNLGHIYSRFKTWTWSSIAFQRELFNEAAKQGFAPGAVETERLARLMTANMFMVALSSIFPYTLFDSVLPGGLGVLQNLSDWAFGDDAAQERAFYAQGNLILKGPLAPLNEFMPPITRLPAAIEQGFTWAISSPEIDIAKQYALWSAFPFGRMGRDVYKAMRDPAMAVDFMLGIPLHRLQKMSAQQGWTASQQYPPNRKQEPEK